jgi:acyl-CoA thioester hydrolase
MDDVFDDIITTSQQVNGASIRSLQHCKRGGEILVKAKVRVAFVSGGRAQRIPRKLREAMTKVRGG